MRDIVSVSYEYFSLKRWWWRAPALLKLFVFSCLLFAVGIFTPLHALAWIGILLIVLYVAYFVAWLSPLF